jgi:hypothetical protein
MQGLYLTKKLAYSQIKVKLNKELVFSGTAFGFLGILAVFLEKIPSFWGEVRFFWDLILVFLELIMAVLTNNPKENSFFGRRIKQILVFLGKGLFLGVWEFFG